MNTFQKIEVGASIASTLSITFYICYFFYYFGFEKLLNDPVRGNSVDEIVIIFIIVWLLSVLFALGTYCNVVKRNKFVALIPCLGAVLIIVILALLSFFALIYSGVLAALLIIAPAIFAFVTFVFAVSQTAKKLANAEQK